MGEIAVQERPATRDARGRNGQIVRAAPGRPTTYDDDTAKAICDDVRQGLAVDVACARHGVGRERYYAWRQLRSDFSDAVSRAYAEAEAYYQSVIRRATEHPVGEVEYKAAVEWLKRQRRASWGDTLDIRKVDTATLLQLLQAQQTDAIAEDGEPVAAITAEDVL